MKALVFAYSDIGVESLQTLYDVGEDVVGVVTHADDPNEMRWFRSVEEWAREKRIPVMRPENPNHPEVHAWAKERCPDVLFSFYYRQLLKKPLLRLPPMGAFNLHGSLLPKFRGRACVNWALIEGASETGVTLHEMVERADAGDIVDQERVPILENDTARDVFAKLVPAARRLLTRTVPLLREGHAPRIPQREAEATTFGARRPEEGRIDWNWPARRIHNWVRALTRPYPGAFALLKGKKFFIWKGYVGGEPMTGRPGQVLESRSEGVPIVTGDGVYVVQEAQWEGEASQPAHEILTRSVICEC